MVQKYGVLGARAGFKITVERCGRFASEGNLALLAALAAHANPAFAEIEIFQIQSHQFADAQAAAVQQFEDGQIARRIGPLEFIGCDAVHQGVGLLGGHHHRQRLGSFGRAHQPGDIGRDHAFAQQKFEERPHGGQLAPHAHGGQPLRVQMPQPLADRERSISSTVTFSLMVK